MLNYWRVNYVIRKRRDTPMLSPEVKMSKICRTLDFEPYPLKQLVNICTSINKNRWPRDVVILAKVGRDAKPTELRKWFIKWRIWEWLKQIIPKNDWFSQDWKNNRGFPMMSHFGANFSLGVYVLEKQLYRVGCTNVDTGARPNIGLLLISLITSYSLPILSPLW